MQREKRKNFLLMLEDIRKSGPVSERKTAFLSAVFVLILGTVLGVFSKWLDVLPLDSSIWWHRIIEVLDLPVVFSQFPVWLLTAAAIAVYSRGPGRAAVRTFLFFAGMCAAYHLCTAVFAGFDASSYMMIWYGITLLSPVLAVMCWYAKGKGPAACLLSILILAVTARFCFGTGLFYFYLNGLLNLLFFIGMAAVLYYSPLRTVLTVLSGIILSMLLTPLLPF